MTEETATPAAEGRALSVRPLTSSASDIALYDTAAFDQMGRVAMTMANSWMLPESITHKGSGNDKEALPLPVIQARALLIVNQARELEVNALAFAQCCSMINGRLQLEGKLVNAIIRRRTGVELAFEYGVWDTDHFEAVADKSELNGIGERLAIRCYDPDRPAREVSGSVGMWKTTRTGSPWSKATDWPRQLAYRAVPEWARRYEPGAILGIPYSDADADPEDFTDARGPKTRRGTADKLAGAATGEQVAQSTVAEAARDAGHEAEDAVFTDGAPAAEETAEKATGGDGPDVGPKLTEQAAAAMRARADELAKIAPGDDDAGDVLGRLEGAHALGQPVADGHAEEDEVYLLAGLEPNEAGKWLTFKNGTRFSTKANVEGLKVYAIHAAEPSAEDDDDDGLDQPCDACGAAAGEECAEDCPAAAEAAAEEEAEVAERPTEAGEPTATDGVPAAESEPATSETATPASDAGAGQAAGSGPSTPEADAAPPEGFIATLRPMTSWLQIKPAVIAMNKTSDWLSASESDQNEGRRAIWGEVERVKKDHRDPVDHAGDLTAFGLWMATQKGRDGADAVEGTLGAIKRDANIWPKLPDAMKAAVEARVAAFIKANRG